MGPADHEVAVIGRPEQPGCHVTSLDRELGTYQVNSSGDMPYIRPSSVLSARRWSKRFDLDDYTYRVSR
ncbi:hypothetical protein [Amycolatopsis cihanbeyliensis]|uniref:hypothetical protein n=1 Tax=Amycolatopsis cihanbeyliensis TaxID=1128664 RepID=UPI001154F0C1|nr:hypothetical protein [Amycolatopsis cihanbeyliensis]